MLSVVGCILKPEEQKRGSSRNCTFYPMDHPSDNSLGTFFRFPGICLNVYDISQTERQHYKQMATKQRNVFSFYLAIFLSPAIPYGYSISLLGTRLTVDKDNLCRKVDSLQEGRYEQTLNSVGFSDCTNYRRLQRCIWTQCKYWQSFVLPVHKLVKTISPAAQFDFTVGSLCSSVSCGEMWRS